MFFENQYFYYRGLHSKFITFCRFSMNLVVFWGSTSTKNWISPRSVNGFSKIRMLGESTMTGYPTGAVRSRRAGPGGPKSPILCGDHPWQDRIPLKKTRDYIAAECCVELWIGAVSTVKAREHVSLLFTSVFDVLNAFLDTVSLSNDRFPTHCYGERV